MEKKFKFSDNPNAAKIIYGAVIALLCITAVIIGIVAANSRHRDNTPEDNNPPIVDENGGNGTQNDENQNTPNNPENPDASDKTGFIAPIAGTVMKPHSNEIPVFSQTLDEWRVHLGIDISAEEGAEVFAIGDGVVSEVYSDPLLGYTVEITHENGTVSRYSNLSADGLAAKDSVVKSGEKIANLGDSAISELADEPHLHFEIMINGVSLNPLDYISDEAKKTSLGISEENDA